jgi:mannitol-1-phosphate/altronate dehydrogenase
MADMNTTFLAQRAAILEQMAALQTMEQGSLKSEYRVQSSGAKSGPYFKHQVWREGANVSQRISTADAPALEAAISHRQQFESMAASFVALTVAHTRQNKFPESLKKKILPASSPNKKRSRR